MRAITILEPWASCIAVGAKNVENRSFYTSYRGPLLIHTSRRIDYDAAFDGRVRAALWPHLSTAEARSALNDLDKGVIIAVAELVDVHEAATIPTLLGDSGTCCEPWGERLHVGSTVRTAQHLVLANVRRLANPVPAKGALGLWRPDAQTIARVRGELQQAVTR